MIWCSVNRALRMAISLQGYIQYAGRSLNVDGPVCQMLTGLTQIDFC